MDKKFVTFWNEQKNPITYDTYNRTVLQEFLDVVDQKIISVVSAKNKILEIGCGTGRFVHKFKQFNSLKQIYGIDPALNMLKVSKANGIVNIACSVGEMLPFADETFDAVIGAYYSFRYLNRTSAYKEIYRVLKNEGILVFDIPNFYAYKLEAVLKNAKKFDFALQIEGKIGFDELNLKSIHAEKNTLEQEGFKVLNIFSRPYLPFLRRFIRTKKLYSGILNTIGYDYLFLAKKI